MLSKPFLPLWIFSHKFIHCSVHYYRVVVYAYQPKHPLKVINDLHMDIYLGKRTQVLQNTFLAQVSNKLIFIISLKHVKC